MHRNREKPGYRLKLENYPKGQRILQLKSKICSTTPTKSIGSLTGIGSLTSIEKPININNISGNKEADHLLYRDSKKVDYLF